MACGCASIDEGGGGVGPPIVTVERNPHRWRECIRERWRFVWGMDVRPRRALEAF